MGIQDLERVALESYNGNFEAITRPDSISLSAYENFLGISVHERISDFRTGFQYPILIGDVGCNVGVALAKLQELEYVEAFGIDIQPIYSEATPFRRERRIVANLENMPGIPDNTFDYLISYRTLHHTRVNLSLPEIHRILRHGGVADLSLRNWFLYQDAIKSAGLGNNLILYSLVSELHGVLGEFVSQLKEKYGNIWDLEPEVHETRFELKKPI